MSILDEELIIRINKDILEVAGYTPPYKMTWSQFGSWTNQSQTNHPQTNQYIKYATIKYDRIQLDLNITIKQDKDGGWSWHPLLIVNYHDWRYGTKIGKLRHYLDSMRCTIQSIDDIGECEYEMRRKLLARQIYIISGL